MIPLATLAFAFGFALAAPGLAQAQEHAAPAQADLAQPVVVELFTSQGCSSCPPADALLLQLAQRHDVLALALHVDYWDYIGWKDIFASPAYTQRQKGYARAAGRKMIYTPQAIVMGGESVSGGDAMALSQAITDHHSKPRLVGLQVRRAQDAVTITLTPKEALADQPIMIQILRYSPLETVEITRGELAGRRIDYANIVETIDHLATWNGQQRAAFTLPYPEGTQGAIVVQYAPYGAILAAARID